jgi:hypothetical protein
MSHALISRNPDLQQLRDEGYNISVVSPAFTDGRRAVRHRQPRGEIRQLVSPLQLNNDRIDVPTQHVIFFAGEHPCDKDGVELHRIKHSSNRQVLAEGVVVDHSFSSKPAEGYKDYYHKMLDDASVDCCRCA